MGTKLPFFNQLFSSWKIDIFENRLEFWTFLCGRGGVIGKNGLINFTTNVKKNGNASKKTPERELQGLL